MLDAGCAVVSESSGSVVTISLDIEALDSLTTGAVRGEGGREGQEAYAWGRQFLVWWLFTFPS